MVSPLNVIWSIESEHGIVFSSDDGENVDVNRERETNPNDIRTTEAILMDRVLHYDGPWWWVTHWHTWYHWMFRIFIAASCDLNDRGTRVYLLVACVDTCVQSFFWRVNYETTILAKSQKQLRFAVAYTIRNRRPWSYYYLYISVLFSLSPPPQHQDVAENPDSVQVLLYSFIVVGFVLMLFLCISINNISKILSPNTPIT